MIFGIYLFYFTLPLWGKKNVVKSIKTAAHQQHLFLSWNLQKEKKKTNYRMAPDLSFFPCVGVHHILCHTVTFTERRLLLPTVGLNCLHAARSLCQTTLLFSEHQKRQQLAKVLIPLIYIMSLNGLVLVFVKAKQQPFKLTHTKNPSK